MDNKVMTKDLDRDMDKNIDIIYNYFCNNHNNVFQLIEGDIKYKDTILYSFSDIIDNCELGYINNWIITQKGYICVIFIMSIFIKYKYLFNKEKYLYDEKTLYFIEMGISDYYKKLNVYEKILIINVYANSENLRNQFIAKKLLSKINKTPDIIKYAHKINKNIIILQKYNRFPIRNNYLDRASSLDEIDYLDSIC